VIRVVIADDHTILREGLKQLLQSAGDLDVVGEAGDGHEVLREVRDRDFDVLLLDMSMPGRSGPELIKQVKTEKPKLRILVLSMHEEHQYAVRAIKSGASGYLTKESASTQLVSAIRKVASGGAFISAEVAEALALNAMATVAGLWLAQRAMAWGVTSFALVANDGVPLPFWITPSLPAMSIVYGIGLALVATAMTGMLPALKMTRGVSSRLREATAGGGGLNFGGVWTVVITGVVVAFLLLAVGPRVETYYAPGDAAGLVVIGLRDLDRNDIAGRLTR